MRPSIVKIAAWGDRYVASLQENILPCLMAPGNLPALSQFSPTTLLLYLDRDIGFEPNIPGLKVITHLVEGADDLPANRRVLAHTDAESVRIALAKDADWFSFQADTLISDIFLPRVKRLLVDHLAVAGSPVRMNIELFRAMARNRRAFPADLLRGMSMAFMHPVTANYFVRDPPATIPADPHQLLFKTPGGFVARTWQFCPFGISWEGLQPIDAWDDDTPTVDDDSTIDCYLVQSLPGKRVRFHVPAVDEFYLTSLDEPSGIPKFGEFEMSAAGVANSIRKFSRDLSGVIHCHLALQQRFAYPTDITLPDSLGEEETLEAVRKALLT